MPPVPAIHLEKPLRAVSVLNGFSGNEGLAAPGQTGPSVPPQQDAAEQAALMRELQTQKQLYHDVSVSLQEVVVRLNQLYDEVFAGHHEAIARLSIEIARKVLMRNISDRDYEIESIIKEALKDAPESSGVVVHLNPRDLADLRALQDADEAGLSGVELVGDADVGQAECVVQCPKGVVKLLIDEHLEQISKALLKTG
jgi:flagellar biosynthesis/type III secretory pathway protein FliH